MSITKQSIVEKFTRISSEIIKYKDVQTRIKNGDKQQIELYKNNTIAENNIITNGENATPILMRTFNECIGKEDMELLEALSNLKIQFNKNIVQLSNFSIREVQYIINFMDTYLSREIDELNIYIYVEGFTLFADDYNNYYIKKLFDNDKYTRIYIKGEMSNSDKQYRIKLNLM